MARTLSILADSIDHFISRSHQILAKLKSYRFGSRHINYKSKVFRLIYRQISGISAIKYLHNLIYYYNI